MPRSYEAVPARWAAHNEGRSKYSSKTGKRCSFSGPTFYSYRTPVAVYHRGVDGQLFVLASSDKWSVSTNSHLHAAIGAAYRVPVFRTPLIGTGGGFHHENLHNPEAMHASNAFANMATVLMFEETYARSWRRALLGGVEEYMLTHIKTIVENMESYCRLTGTKLPANYVPYETIAQRLTEGWRQAKDKYDDPKAVRRRERAHARRLAREVLEG